MPIPPSVAVDAEPASCLVVNQEWLSHVQGLLNPGAKDYYWDANAFEGTQGIENIQDFMARSNCDDDRALVLAGWYE